MSKLALVLVPLCAALANSALAQAPALPTDPLPHFVRAGGGFACRVSRETYEQVKDKQVDHACMKIGPLAVGMARDDVEAILHAPFTTIEAGGRENFAYALLSDARGEVVTYAVVRYADDGRADLIQITGEPWRDVWRFSGIGLGDSEQALRQRLGEPFGKEAGGDPGVMTWFYNPWNFSFEVVGGLVTSIRVSE